MYIKRLKKKEGRKNLASYLMLDTVWGGWDKTNGRGIWYFISLLMQQNKMLLLTNSFRGRKPQGNLLSQFDESDCQVVGCIGDHCASLN